MSKLIIAVFILLALVTLASLVFMVINFIRAIEYPNINSILYSIFCLIILGVCIGVIVWLTRKPKKT